MIQTEFVVYKYTKLFPERRKQLHEINLLLPGSWGSEAGSALVVRCEVPPLESVRILAGCERVPTQKIDSGRPGVLLLGKESTEHLVQWFLH